jgi:hypothetical protein
MLEECINIITGKADCTSRGFIFGLHIKWKWASGHYSESKEQRNIVHEISKRKANWIGHIWHWNCLLQQVIEGKIKGGIGMAGRRGRCRKLLDDLKQRRGYSHLEEEPLDRTVWRARFGRGFGPVMRQTAKWMNEWPQVGMSSTTKSKRQGWAEWHDHPQYSIECSSIEHLSEGTRNAPWGWHCNAETWEASVV